MLGTENCGATEASPNLRNLTGRAENLTAEHRVEESDVQSTES